MTTATRTDLIWRASTEAENFNWIKKISDSLDAIGVALTANTGQIVLTGSTVALPTALDNTFKPCGYQIRRLVSSGKPTIYIKVEYGVRRAFEFSDLATNNYPTLKFTFATQTDGAASVTGPTFLYSIYSAEGYYRYAQPTPVTPRPMFFSSDGANYLTMLIDPAVVGAGTTSQSSAYSPLCTIFERSIDATTGEYDGDGMLLINSNMGVPSGSSSAVRQLCNIPAGVNYISGGVPAQIDPLFTSSGSADATTVFPVTVLLPRVKGPMKSLLYFYLQDAPPGLTFSANVYGEVHTYITTGPQTNLLTLFTNSCAAALRFD